jgi:hypothetical protein
MKSATFVSGVAAALLLAGPWLGAQPNGQSPPKITVDVPIDFMVGHSMFPSGNYTVKPRDRAFYLQATHGRESARIVTKPILTSVHPDTARLIFAEENGHYYLREIWMSPAIGAKVLRPETEQLRTVGESRLEVPAVCPTCK